MMPFIQSIRVFSRFIEPDIVFTLFPLLTCNMGLKRLININISLCYPLRNPWRLCVGVRTNSVENCILVRASLSFYSSFATFIVHSLFICHLHCLFIRYLPPSLFVYYLFATFIVRLLFICHLHCSFALYLPLSLFAYSSFASVIVCVILFCQPHCFYAIIFFEYIELQLISTSFWQLWYTSWLKTFLKCRR